jgi:hypothetical protein
MSSQASTSLQQAFLEMMDQEELIRVALMLCVKELERLQARGVGVRQPVMAHARKYMERLDVYV